VNVPLSDVITKIKAMGADLEIEATARYESYGDGHTQSCKQIIRLKAGELAEALQQLDTYAKQLYPSHPWIFIWCGTRTSLIGRMVLGQLPDCPEWREAVDVVWNQTSGQLLFCFDLSLRNGQPTADVVIGLHLDLGDWWRRQEEGDPIPLPPPAAASSRSLPHEQTLAPSESLPPEQTQEAGPHGRYDYKEVRRQLFASVDETLRAMISQKMLPADVASLQRAVAATDQGGELAGYWDSLMLRLGGSIATVRRDFEQLRNRLNDEELRQVTEAVAEIDPAQGTGDIYYLMSRLERLQDAIAMLERARARRN
jgi:hypothetical protein